VPDDAATADRALVAGRTVTQVDPRGASRLGGGLARLAATVQTLQTLQTGRAGQTVSSR
jgi:hypothetical protein